MAQNNTKGGKLARDIREKSTLSVDETARILDLSRGSTYQAIAAGEIPSLRIGKRILIPRVRLQRMLEGNGARPTNEA